MYELRTNAVAHRGQREVPLQKRGVFKLPINNNHSLKRFNICTDTIGIVAVFIIVYIELFLKKKHDTIFEYRLSD